MTIIPSPSSSSSLSDNKKTIYVYDPETNTLIPYRPDYTVGVPLVAGDKDIHNITTATTTTTPKQDKQLGVIVPLIRQPPNQSDWVQLATIARKYPRVNTVAVVSPTHDQRGIGDFGGTDPEYQNAIRFLQANGVVVVGYIDFVGFTGQKKTLDDLKREVNRWREWYPEVQGLYITPEKGTSFEECEALAGYAKIDRAFNLVILDLAGSNYTDGGGVINRPDDYVSIMPAVDVFVIYNREGYPADGWYNSIRKGWMSKYDRSRFAFIPYKVGENTLECRNFVDRVVGIEKLAGYVYVHSAYETDRRKLREWTNISILLETTLEQLDREARQERMPFTKGVAPDATKPLTPEEKADADARAARGGDSEDPVAGMPRDQITLDKFGVRKIYPTAPDNMGGGKEWHIFMDNPRADHAFRNLPDSLTKEADGSWSLPNKNSDDGDDGVRLEVWSPKNSNKYLNVEITGYFKILKLPSDKKDDNSKYVITQSAPRGGGSHNEKNVAEGSAYNGILLKDGAVCAVKDIAFNTSTGMRGMAQATNNDLLNRWIGMKTVVYNYPKMDSNDAGKEHTFVAIEIWIDDNVTDPQDGRLVVKNDWKHILKVIDEGGWFTTTDALKSLLKEGKKTSKKKKQQKRDDKILTEPGGANDANCVAFSWDKDSIINFKFLSVREIDVVRRD